MYCLLKQMSSKEITDSRTDRPQVDTNSQKSVNKLQFDQFGQLFTVNKLQAKFLPPGRHPPQQFHLPVQGLDSGLESNQT